jgi:hypothetical protein
MEKYLLSSHVPCHQLSSFQSLHRAERQDLPLTFLLGNQVLHNDISHAVPIGITVLVKPMDCVEDQLVEANGAILAAYCLQGRGLSIHLCGDTDLPFHLSAANTSALTG